MQTIMVSGGNCYVLAAKYLGDATQFIRIMLQNDLTDPVLLPGPVKLIIPDVDATQTGGLAPQ